jgi:hypothetical protein
MSSSWWKKPKWLVFILVMLVVGQAYLAFTGFVRPLAWSIRRFGLVSSIQRSQIVYMGANEARYLRFLNQVIPTDASVVIPDSSGFVSQSVMQLFLLPRPIHAHCAGGVDAEGCQRVLLDPTSFVLAIDEFPHVRDIQGKVFLAYPDADERYRGVYVPSTLVDAIHVDPGAYTPTQSIPLSAPFIDLTVLAAIFLLGGLYVALLLGRPTWLELVGLSLPLGISILTWTIFLTSYLGLPIRLWSVGILYLLLAAMAVGLFHLVRKSMPALPELSWRDLSPARYFQRDRLGTLLTVLAFLWLGFAGVVSLGRSYTVFDEIAIWSLKGYAIAQQGTIQAGSQWGGHILAYPLNIPLSIGIFWLADGDSLPGSKAMFPLLAASLLISCYRFWRMRGSSHTLSILGVLVLGTQPFFFRHATYGMADLTYTAYLALGVLWSTEAAENGRPGHYLLAGWLFAGAAWTRPEGIGFSAALMAAMLAIQRWRRVRFNWRAVAAYILPLSFPLIWLLLLGARNMQVDSIGRALDATQQAVLSRAAILPSIRHVVAAGWRLLLNWRQTGLLTVPAILVPLVYLPIHRWYRDRISLSLGVATLVAAVIPLFVFFVESFSVPDIEAILAGNLNRACLPAFVLLIMFASQVIRAAPDRR